MSRKLDRRSFLGHGLAGFSLAATAPHFLGLTARVFAAEGDADSDRVLVVLQLSGGNDGLSTVVPFADPAYHRARRTIAIAEKDVLQLDDHVGLHAGLPKLHALYRAGKMAVVQGCSYPNPNRSHFKSMDIWHAGDLRGRSLRTGWLGRAIDACCPDRHDPELVVNVGPSIPYALEADVHKPISFDQPNAYRWAGNPRDREEFERLNEQAAEGDDTIRWLHRIAVDARASSEKVREAASGYRPRAEYGRSPLGRDLRTVAALLAGGLKTRIYYVSFGGFDTHNGQRNRHDNLMRQLDAALGAFWADLEAQGLSKRVVVLSFSEFGRRVAENGSLGTDHGVAGPMFVYGDAVRGGLHGSHPSLTDLDAGDLKMKVDFRTVYAGILEDWVGVPADRVLGRRFPKLPVL
ncbi:MAG: DUF1501 domain-containing protein [Planctomycetota bacterium]